MALTREQRKKIEREEQLKMEEEEYRAEVRKNARTEAEGKDSGLSLPARLLLVLIGIGVADLYFSGSLG